MDQTHFQSIRIDLIDGDVQTSFQSFLETFKEVIHKGFIVLEEGKITGKKHIQGILEIMEEKVLKDMRNYIIRKVLKNKATKGDYSFCKVRKTEEDYMIYLCKGGEGSIELNEFKEGTPLEVIFQLGYTDEQIKTYRETAVQKQEKYLKTKQSKTVGQSLIDHIKSKEDEFLLEEKPLFCVNDKQYCHSKCGKFLDKKHLLRLIIRFFSMETKKFRSFLIEEYYNLLEHQYSPKTTEDRIIKDLEEKLNFKYIY